MHAAELLQAHGFTDECVFYLPTKTELNLEQIIHLHRSGFHIGGHTVTHPQDMKRLSDLELADELVENKKWLEELIGETIFDFAYTRGRHDDRVRRYTAGAGYLTGRTTLVLNTDLAYLPYEKHTTIHMFNGRKEYDHVRWYDVALRQLEIAEQKGSTGRYHVWGHTNEMTRNDWYDFQRLLEVLNTKGYGN